MSVELIAQQHPFAALIDRILIEHGLSATACRLDVPESSLRNWSTRPGRIPGSPTLEQVRKVARRMDESDQLALFEIVFGGTRLVAEIRSQRSEVRLVDAYELSRTILQHAMLVHGEWLVGKVDHEKALEEIRRLRACAARLEGCLVGKKL